MNQTGMNRIGINLSFTVKRWIEPDAWADHVSSMGLDLIQFSFDLIDPLWPANLRSSLAKSHRQAAESRGITIHSAFVGLACYTYNNLLHPLPEGREAAKLWWRGAIETAAELGTSRVGGPLGGMSVRDANDPKKRQERLEVLRADVLELLDYAQSHGLQEFVIEPVPLTRETPHTVAEARGLLVDLKHSVPVRFCLDIGHALYRPLYGDQASLEPWLGLGDSLGLLHLQQTDGISDSHWGLDDPRGIVKLEEVRDQLNAHKLTNLPVILEVFYAFEATDEFVLEDVRSSVAQMQKTWC
jgi:D-erythrulose 1-phosphate 3-epimerase